MEASTSKSPRINASLELKINNFMMLLGRHYQVRDDYLDLAVSTEDTSSDLDQGNYSLPLIHALACQQKQGSSQLRSILKARKFNNGMLADMKKLVLSILENESSLEYVKKGMHAPHPVSNSVLAYPNHFSLTLQARR